MKIGTQKNISEKIRGKDFKIKKKFGQNFLVDQNILKKIVSSSSATKESLIIEIGPGMGSLTEHLIHNSKHVLAYEIDKDLIPILSDTFTEKITLINDDFLERNIDKDIADLNMQFDKVVVVANLPYYITTPIIFKILEQSKEVSEMLLMMQLEVARRLTSKPKTKDYNALSVIIQYKAITSIALKVPRSVFIPAPNVDSAVVKLNIIADSNKVYEDEKYLFKVIKASFAQRRKTLANNLSNNLGIEKDLINKLLISNGYRSDIRAETFEINDFVALTNALKALNKAN